MSNLVRLCRELDTELDGVKLPRTAAGIMNAIRACLEAIDAKIQAAADAADPLEESR